MICLVFPYLSAPLQSTCCSLRGPSRFVRRAPCYQFSRAKGWKIGLFRPTMLQDAKEFIKKCDKCQYFINFQHLPALEMTPISSPWPFSQWGIDLVGPFPESKGQTKYVVVAIDYFIKWDEAEALARITSFQI